VNENKQNGDGDATMKQGVSAPPRIKNMASHRADSEGAIGAGLRSLYQDIVKEPLPDDMMALLDKLGSKDTDEK
jgi:hypothetical protein